VKKNVLAFLLGIVLASPSTLLFESGLAFVAFVLGVLFGWILL